MNALVVEQVDGAAAATRVAASDPLKLLITRSRGPAVWACAATYGGGLVAGDRIDLEVDVGAGSALCVGTQSTTKVYRSDGGTASQQVTARVADGGLLAWVPEPTSCFAGSRFHQRIHLDLHPTASLAWLDAVSAGRIASGERWDHTSFRSRLDLHIGGRLVARDDLRLEPPALVERMHGHVVLAALWLVGARCRAAAALASQALPGLLAAASPLPGGCLLRLAAPSHDLLAQTVRRILAPLADALGGQPWNRLAAVEHACT